MQINKINYSPAFGLKIKHNKAYAEFLQTLTKDEKKLLGKIKVLGGSKDTIEFENKWQWYLDEDESTLRCKVSIGKHKSCLEKSFDNTTIFLKNLKKEIEQCYTEVLIKRFDIF